MKKNIISVLALVLALASLLLAGFTWLTARNQAEDYTARLEKLETELLQLQSQTAETLPPSDPSTDTETEEAYCSLHLGDWTCNGDMLVLSVAYAQVLTVPELPLTGAALVLELNGNAVSSTVLKMNPGEASDSYELDLAGFSLALPELATGDHLELHLEAILSDGTVLTAVGGTWDWENGQLLMVAG